MRVLYVGTSTHAADVVAVLAERSMVSVERVRSTEDALDRLAEGRIDCVVSEHDLPESGGVTALRRVRDRYPDLPFVLFAPGGDVDPVAEALEAGVTDYVPHADREGYDYLADRIRAVVADERARRTVDDVQRINAVIRRVNRTLVRADTQQNLERQVCEILSEADPYQFAWIGSPDPETNVVEPRTWAGIDAGYLDDISVTIDDSASGQGPGGRALQTGDPVVVQNVLSDPSFEPWRSAAVERGFQSVVALPLCYEDRDFGLLSVYADRPFAFDTDERALLSEVADDIAYAIDAIEHRTVAARHAELTEHLPVGVFRTEATVDGRIVEANPAMASFLGVDDPAALVGRTAREFYVDDADRATILDRLDEMGGLTEEVELQTADGERVWGLLTEVRYEDPDGRRFIDGAVVDVTERKASERELELFRTLVDHSSDGIYVLDADTGAIVQANAGACEALGYDRDELTTMTVMDVEETVDGRAAWADHVADVEARDTLQTTGVHVRRDGTTFPVEVSSTVVETDRERYVVAIARDITEREHRVTQLRVLGRVLRHNLRNDMTVVRGYADDIRDAATGEVGAAAEAFVDAVDDLLVTSEKAHEFDELTLGDPPEIETLPLDGVVERARERVEHRQPGVEVAVDVPSGLSVRAIASLDWAVGELLENAVVHNDGNPTVTVSASVEDERVALHIADDGPRIPDHERAVLTDQRAIDPLYHGSGLGLWVVRWIVTFSGGDLAFEPNDPTGNVVTIRFGRVTAD